MRLQVVDPSHDDNQSWAWQLRHAITDLAALRRELRRAGKPALSKAEERGTSQAMEAGLPLSITPYYLSLFDSTNLDCPIRRQCVPTAAEADGVPGDLRDPLGEESHEVAPQLIQRYPDRALLLATDRCAVYCRFCTRSRMVGAGGGTRSMERLETAFQYLETHPEIQEVIISGGDPAVMSDERLRALLERLAEIPTLNNVRFATRVPVTLPQRVTPAFIEALKSHPALWLMTHFNHPKELTEAASRALSALADGGVPVMNQTVLLRGVNDRVATLEPLFRGLVRRRVRPYYLLQADVVRGTGHLRTPLRTGLTLMEALQGRVSGIALPKLIVDTPNGRGKVVLSPNVIVAEQPGVTWLQTFRGERVAYLDPPDAARR